MNLVISSTCGNIAEIRNLFGFLGTLTSFLCASPKRKGILQRYLDLKDTSNIVVGDAVDLPAEEQEEADKLVLRSTNKQVPKLCETRWSARVITLSSVMAKYKAIFLIAGESLTSDVRVNALSHVKRLQSSSFIVSLVVAQFILSFSHPLWLSLQNTNCDVIKVYQNARLRQTTISKQRNETKFGELWRKAKVIADDIGTELTKPRTVAISRFRSNSGVNTKDAENAETYYRRNIYYPFIDHCLKELSEQFPESSLSRFTGYNLHPDKVLQIKQVEMKNFLRKIFLIKQHLQQR